MTMEKILFNFKVNTQPSALRRSQAQGFDAGMFGRALKSYLEVQQKGSAVRLEEAALMFDFRHMAARWYGFTHVISFVDFWTEVRNVFGTGTSGATYKVMVPAYSAGLMNDFARGIAPAKRKLVPRENLSSPCPGYGGSASLLRVA